MRAIVITANPNQVTIQDVDGWEGMREVVSVGEHGLLQRIGLNDCAAFVDEEGMLKSLRPNLIGTQILQRMLGDCGRMLIPGDYIKGTIVFSGEKYDEEGTVVSDISDEVINEYFPGVLA